MSDQRSEDKAEELTEEASEYRRRAREHTVAGAALGTASAGAFVTLGAIACPLCLVAAPVLIGSGVWNARRAKQCQGEECTTREAPPQMACTALSGEI